MPREEFLYSVKKPRTFLFLELETVIQLLSPSSLVMVGERAEGKAADQALILFLEIIEKNYCSLYNWQ